MREATRGREGDIWRRPSSHRKFSRRKHEKILWLAGLIEGEGSFLLGQSSEWNSISPAISIAMSDKDIIQRVTNIFHSKMYKRRNATNTMMYKTLLQGRKAIKWMQLIIPYMGVRRSKRIKEIISLWQAKELVKKPHFNYSCNHRNKKHWAKGLCRSCYYKEFTKLSYA